MMDWAVLLHHETSTILNHTLPPFRDSPGGGMVLNEFTIRGETAYVTLPNRCTNSSDTATVTIDAADLPKMDKATDQYWQYDAPGHLPRGAYLPRTEKHKAQGLARVLLDAPHGTYRLFKDGDALNCRRANLALLPHTPLQRDWLWNAPLPDGFFLVRKMENAVSVVATPSADPRLMWQYLLERWQFCRSKGIRIVPPRVSHEFAQHQRITAIVCRGMQTFSYDIGDDGAREWQEYDTCATELAA